MSSEFSSRMSGILVNEESRVREALTQALAAEAAVDGEEAFNNLKGSLQRLMSELAETTNNSVEEVLSQETTYLDYIASMSESRALSLIAGRNVVSSEQESKERCVGGQSIDSKAMGTLKEQWLSHIASLGTGAALNFVSNGKLAKTDGPVVGDLIEREANIRNSLIEEQLKSSGSESEFVEDAVTIAQAAHKKIYEEIFVTEKEEGVHTSKELKCRLQDGLKQQANRIRSELTSELSEASGGTDSEIIERKESLKSLMERLTTEANAAISEILSQETDYLNHIAGLKEGPALTFISQPPMPHEGDSDFQHLATAIDVTNEKLLGLEFLLGRQAPVTDKYNHLNHVASTGSNTSALAFVSGNTTIPQSNEAISTTTTTATTTDNNHLTYVSQLGLGTALSFLVSGCDSTPKPKKNVKPKHEQTFEELQLRSAFEQGVLKSMWQHVEETFTTDIESEGCMCGSDSCDIRTLPMSDKIDYTRWTSGPKGFTHLWSKKRVKKSIVDFFENSLTISQQLACLSEWKVKYHKKERLYHYSNVNTKKRSYFPTKEVDGLTKCNYPTIERVKVSDKLTKSLNRILTDHAAEYEAYLLKKAAKKLIVLDPEKLVDDALKSGIWAERTAIGGSKVYYVPRKGKGLEKKWKDEFAPFLISQKQEKYRKKIGDFATPYCKKCDRHFALPPPRWECNKCRSEVYQPVTGVKSSRCKCCDIDISKTRQRNRNCKKCGYLCCEDCTQQEMPLVSMGWSGVTLLTVCTSCSNRS
eukprot:TRINITY_DN206_c0_g1_i3.p1 TRINITY_DN206_c0_g1~~TRINITY_DN206_c0_g1_i3.p1  ORF type:complete len:759 (+),score=130.66 TRINITY_DN206_c0_g1_i3:797-3073(+)